MNSDQHRVVHNLHLLEEVAICKHLLSHEIANIRWQGKGRFRKTGANIVILLDFLSGPSCSSRHRPFQIKEALQMLVRIEHRVHNDELDIPSQMV